VLGTLCVIDTKPHQWTAEDAAALMDLAQIVTDEIALRLEIRHRKEAEAQQSFLIAELHHRVKNTLATVQAVVQMSLRAATDLPSFSAGIASRIASLANTHTLLSENNWSAVSFRELLASELAPYGAGRVTLDGPDFRLSSQTAVTIGMVFHELTTNASKYGALRTPDGAISVTWTVQEDAADNVLALRWIEVGGPKVTTPTRDGFGSNLLRRLIERQLSGKVDMAFEPDGLRVTLRAKLPAVLHAGPFPPRAAI
jgi:two-component sensor histidine kinase